MTPDATPLPTAPSAPLRAPGRWLALLAFLVAALTATGNLTNDPYTRYVVAENLVHEGSVAIDPSRDDRGDRPGRLLLVEHDGASYSVFWPGQSVTMLPVALAVEGVRRVAGSGSERFWRDVGCFLVSVGLVPFLGGLGVLGHVRLVERLGAGTRPALVSGAALAFGSIHWIWASQGAEEAGIGATAIWALVFGLDGRRAGLSLRGLGPDAPERPRLEARLLHGLGAAALLTALGSIHRGTYLAPALGALVLTLPSALAWFGAARRRPLAAAGWILAAGGVLALLPLYNLWRFGDALDSGYARFYEDLGGLWATPLLHGLAGHLFSPGKSLFLYVPWALLAAVALCLPSTWRRSGLVGAAIAATLVVHFLIYSKATFWAGGYGWSVRYHASLMPLLLVPAGVLLGTLRDRAAATGRARPRFRGPILALFALSTIVQLMGLSLNIGLETFQRRGDYDPDDLRLPVEAAWSLPSSPMLLRAENVVDRLAGRDVLPPELAESSPILQALNIFPVRAAIALDQPRVVLAVQAAWGVLLLGAAGAGVGLVHSLRRTGGRDDEAAAASEGSTTTERATAPIPGRTSA